MAKKAKKAARTALKKNARAGVKKALGAKGKTTKGRWTAPGAKARAAAAREGSKTPKQEPLIKGLRIRALDNVFGHISDTRGAIARLQGEEADLEQQAHNLMKKHKQTTWSHAGVTAARIPGEEKLRITTARARGPAPETKPEETEEAGPVQTPERTEAVEDTSDGLGDAGDQADQD